MAWISIERKDKQHIELKDHFNLLIELIQDVHVENQEQQEQLKQLEHIV
jgi:hypothetical protein